jgi:hypothetical protein
MPVAIEGRANHLSRIVYTVGDAKSIEGKQA